MVPEVTARVERFHEVLIDEILDKQPEYIHSAFKVAEIYQTLVPYRSHRDALGVEMNGDYEDTLLRLLAGAGDLLILESDNALAEIRKELNSSTPNTGRFRDFASADVRLNQAVLPDRVLTSASRSEKTKEKAEPRGNGRAAPAPADAALSEIVVDEPATEEKKPEQAARGRDRGRRSRKSRSSRSLTFEPAPSEERPAKAAKAQSESQTKPAPTPAPVAKKKKPEPAPARPEIKAAEAESSQSSETSMSNCLWCNAALPDRPNVNYCPYCGTSTAVKPCKACGDEMELAWRYCVTCGTEAEEAANAA